MEDVEVYWSARDLDSFFLGNHHFLLIKIPKDKKLTRIINLDEGDWRFITLAGHLPDKHLVFRENDEGDVQSVREIINPKLAGRFYDYDLETHFVNPPNGGGWSFAQSLVDLAFNYRRNSETTPVEYVLRDENCSCWVNTILRVAGVPKNERMKLGEFSGIDWGEEQTLDDNLFKSE
jgi:hypothetical protein